MESRNDSNWKQTSLWPRQEKLLKEWRRLRIRLRDYKEARQSGAVGGGGFVQDLFCWLVWFLGPVL